jgi:hypothetical protein
MMRHLLPAAALLCGAVPVLAQAPAPAPPAPSTAQPETPCLVQRNIYDFQIVPGNRSLVVTDLARRRFRLNFVTACYNIQYKFGLRFKTFGVSQLSCLRRGDQVLFNDPAGPGFCVIRDIQYQTPEMDQQDAAAKAAKVKQY